MGKTIVMSGENTISSEINREVVVQVGEKEEMYVVRKRNKEKGEFKKKKE